jgi:iron complex transport system permease protein
MFAACLLFGLAMMRHVSSQTLILAGIALLFLFQSLLSLLTVPLLPRTQPADPVLAVWQPDAHHLGLPDHHRRRHPDLHPAHLPGCLGLTSLRLGEARARSLGVNVDRLRMKTLVLVALLTATATSFVDVRRPGGPPYRPHAGGGRSALFDPPLRPVRRLHALGGLGALQVHHSGALFPIGIVTALIGVPFFIWLILGRGRKRA